MKVLVAGLINCEVSAPASQFPIEYVGNQFLFNQIEMSVSGVGYNQSCALSTLGADVVLASVIGCDFYGDFISNQLKKHHLSCANIQKTIKDTPRSIILFDSKGQRMAYTDLTEIQNITYSNNIDLSDVSYAIINNILFAKALLIRCKEKNIPIVSDVHLLNDINDVYNHDWLFYSDILFLSNEAIVGEVETFVKELVQRFPKEIVIVGMGEKGSMLYDSSANEIHYQPSIKTSHVKNTIGAGDVLCSSFTYFYFKGKSAKEALYYASYFAAYKIQFSGGAKGFLSELALLKRIAITKTSSKMIR